MAHITVPEDPSNGRSETVVGGTPQDEFNFTFPYFDSADITVYIDGEATQDFTVTGTGSAVDGGYSSGTVTLDTPVSDVTVVIEREVSLARTEDFPYPSSTFNIRALNTALDRIYAILQQFRRKLTRALRQPVTDTDEIADIPAKADRALMLLGFDANGDPEPVDPATGYTVNENLTGFAGLASAADKIAYFTGTAGAMALATFTAFGRTLAGLANAAAGRTALELGTAAVEDTTAFDAAGSAAAAQAASQPLDSDLTAIAALVTTAFGRGVLTQADAAALRTLAGLGTAATFDLEIGTWSPSDQSGAGLTLTSVAGAQYIKIGQIVIACFNVTYPATADATFAAIGGLPYTSQNNSAPQWGGALTVSSYGSALTLVVNTNDTRIYLGNMSGAAGFILNSNASGKLFRGVVAYRASA